MKVLVLGATGLIGEAVTKNLVANGHSVTGLARNEVSSETLTAWQADALQGDVRRPERWAHVIPEFDAIIHLAATFSDDMGAVDRQLVETLCANAIDYGKGPKQRFLYTGGSWLYGETGDHVAKEGEPFDPPGDFVWMVENSEFLAAQNCFSLAIVHPAMVYERDIGGFAGFLEDIRKGRPVELWGSETNRWPLVHRDDLAEAYRILLEMPELEGHFNVSAETGVPVGDIAEALSRANGHEKGIRVTPSAEILAREGSWAEGPMLDIQMSAQKFRGLTGWKPRYPDFRRFFSEA